MTRQPKSLGDWQRIDQGGSLLGTGVGPTDFKIAARKYGRHFARYLHAAGFVADKRTLDAACGTGYGSAWLARSARHVLGVELDEAVLAKAAERFSAPNLRFRRHDLHEPIPADEPFDVVVSFETLEHVTDPAVCLANLAGCLAEDGIALISVPNGTLELSGGRDTHHLTYFSAEQFRQLLAGAFEDVALFSQTFRRGLKHYLRLWTGRGCHHAEDYRFVPGTSAASRTWLARCRRPRRP